MGFVALELPARRGHGAASSSLRDPLSAEPARQPVEGGLLLLADLLAADAETLALLVGVVIMSASWRTNRRSPRPLRAILSPRPGGRLTDLLGDLIGLPRDSSIKRGGDATSCSISSLPPSAPLAAAYALPSARLRDVPPRSASATITPASAGARATRSDSSASNSLSVVIPGGYPEMSRGTQGTGADAISAAVERSRAQPQRRRGRGRAQAAAARITQASTASSSAAGRFAWERRAAARGRRRRGGLRTRSRRARRRPPAPDGMCRRRPRSRREISRSPAARVAARSQAATSTRSAARPARRSARRDPARRRARTRTPRRPARRRT